MQDVTETQFKSEIGCEFKEVPEEILHIQAFAPPKFHLLGEDMLRNLWMYTEAAGMEMFGRPVVLDPSNYLESIDSLPHPLFGKLEPHDENGIAPWRDSWCQVCVYNSSRDKKSVQVSIVAHYCGNIFQKERFLRTIFSSINPLFMRYSFMSSDESQSHGFKEYKPTGDKPFLEIINLLKVIPKDDTEKESLGILLEQLVHRRILLRQEVKKYTYDKETESYFLLPYLESLLSKKDIEDLQKIFGDYEGILEQRTADRIIKSKGMVDIKDFPYYERYNKLTDVELAKSIRRDDIKNICMVGGGWLPISAIMYAQKTNAQISVVEQDASRANIAVQVIKALGLDDRISVICKRGEKVDYSKMDIVVFAAMADPKHDIFLKASKTDGPDTIIIRTPHGDARVLYQGFKSFLHEISFPGREKINHWLRHGFEVQGLAVDEDELFTLYFFDRISDLEEK